MTSNPASYPHLANCPVLARLGCIHDMANFQRVGLSKNSNTLPLCRAVCSTDATLLRHALPFEHNPYRHSVNELCSTLDHLYPVHDTSLPFSTSHLDHV